MTARLNYTFTPDISLQTYLQPFVSKGTYSNVRQLSATPRADKYDDRYAPINNPAVTSDPGGFNFKQLQSNVVFRWEYKPGSTLFAVWNSGRQGFAPRGDRELQRGRARSLRSAPRQHIPRESIVLAQPVSARPPRVFCPAGTPRGLQLADSSNAGE